MRRSRVVETPTWVAIIILNALFVGIYGLMKYDEYRLEQKASNYEEPTSGPAYRARHGCYPIGKHVMNEGQSLRRESYVNAEVKTTYMCSFGRYTEKEAETFNAAQIALWIQKGWLKPYN